MTTRDEVSSLRESAIYQSMFKDIIRNQIQNLLDQLQIAGEHSVLLTFDASLERSQSGRSLGSKLGVSFLQDMTDIQTTFQKYCLQKIVKREPETTNKRRLSDTNGEPWTNVSFRPSDGAPPKISKFESMTCVSATDRPIDVSCSLPLVKPDCPVPVEIPQSPMSTPTQTSPLSIPLHTPVQTYRPDSIHIKQEPIPNDEAMLQPFLPTRPRPFVAGRPSLTLNSNGPLPKGHHRCSMCKYSSKFKANVMRHERSVHSINLDGVTSPNIQYVCAMCPYKSTYRSNVMRHEKSIHKIFSSTSELEMRRISMDSSTCTGQFGANTGDVEYTSQDGWTEDIKYKNITDDTDNIHQDSSYTKSEGNEKTAEDIPENVNEEIKYGEVDADDTFEDHYEDAESDDGLTCNYCQIICDSASQLKQHVDSIHFGARGLECVKCKKLFRNSLNYDLHMSTHVVKQQEVCVCGKSFQYRTALLRHQNRCLSAAENVQVQGQSINRSEQNESCAINKSQDQSINTPELVDS